MTASLKPYLFGVATGVALGLVAAGTSRPTAASTTPDAPTVSHLRGHVSGTHPPRELRPLTLRVGDKLEQLGQANTERPAVATIYMEAGGVPVVASFELE